MAPVVEIDAQRLADQHCRKTGTVDKEIAFDPPVAVEPEPRDIARFGILLNRVDLAFDAYDTARLGVAAQEGRIETGVEMIGLVELDLWIVGSRRPAAPRPHGQGLKIEQAVVFGAFLRRQPQPEMIEVDALHRDAIVAEGVDIAFADLLPIDEFNAQLERRLGLANEVRLGYAEQRVEQVDHRDGRLADPDRADVLGLDQRNRQTTRSEHLCHTRGRHPAGGAAAKDHDSLGRRIHETHRSRKKVARSLHCAPKSVHASGRSSGNGRGPAEPGAGKPPGQTRAR